MRLHYSHLRAGYQFPLAIAPRESVNEPVFAADVHALAVRRFVLAVLHGAMSRDKSGVGIEYSHGKLRDHPGISSQRSRLRVFHVLGLIANATIWINKHRVLGFYAFNRRDISLFDYAWPIVLDAHQFGLN